jgi:D-arabinose 1-dehydrogenase-like Zn-dependent alcohol dehydrogenase
MTAAQIARAGGEFEIVQRPIPEPAANQVRIKVEACGVCHSDAMVKDGHWPGIKYPRVPGHEVAGRIDKVGSAVTAWKVGQRVGVGWYGGHCSQCDLCRAGDFVNCANAHITGISSDGGYAEYMLARQEAVARIPESLSAVDAGPLLCAGITTFNALRNAGARAGDRVAIQGVGGLGHLAIQFARKMGFVTIAVSSDKDKEKLARELGAHHYIDTATGDAAKELQKMGGADLVLATAPSGKAIAPLVQGLSARGKLLIVAAAADPIEVVPITLLSGKTIAGWPSGVAKDSEDTLAFSDTSGVRPMVEVFPLAQVREAYGRMITGKVRFRAVLTMMK